MEKAHVGDIANESAETKMYEEVFAYLSDGQYSAASSKAGKGVIRKRSKKFELLSGVLHYKDSSKTEEPRLRQV